MEDNTQTFSKPSVVAGQSYWHNLSGRFWIALSAMTWLGLATMLVFTGFVKLDSNAAIAVYTAFAAGAFGIVTTYMGQNMKNKTNGGNGQEQK